jgi:hypothetical protein
MTSSEFRDLANSVRDPWYFLTHFVRTEDPVRGVAPFPAFGYLRDFVGSVSQHRFVLTPKSRQMLVTWTMTACTLWRALFRGPGIHLYLSRNERCAEELLQRTRFMLAQLPPHMQPRLRTNSREELAFAQLGSRILSLPASPNGPRMYAPASVFWDEVAFTPFDEEIWAALKPALDSGGTFVGVSSSGGAANLFARWIKTSQCHPERSEGSLGSTSKRDSSLRPKTGFAQNDSTGNLFHIHPIHYSQHPDRNNPEWIAQASLGLSATRWQQEQEISFDVCDDRVYSEFDSHLHILPSDWIVRSDGEIFRSFDFGYHHPFALCLQVTSEGDVIVFDEWAGENRTTEEMLVAVRNVDLVHSIGESRVKWSACDPAGAAVQDAGLSPVDTLRRAGMRLKYRSSRIAPGIECVKAHLQDATGRVRLRISPRCRALIQDFERYRWASSGDEPLKDGLCDHSLDALRYFFVNLDSADEEYVYAPRMAGMKR